VEEPAEVAASSSTYPDHLSGSFLGIMPIERGKIREYAAATGAARPVYVNDPAPPIPPTFLSSVVLWAPIGESTRDESVLEACRSAGVVAELSNMLSLDQEYVFYGPTLRAGETVSVSERLRDVTVKQGRQGPMVLVRFVVSFEDPDGRLRAECLYTSAYLRRDA